MHSQPAPVHPSWLGTPGSDRDVLYQLLIDGPLSRSELALRLGLSAGSLTRVTKPLLARGQLVESQGRHKGPTGRPTQPLELMPQGHHFVGVKLTGTQAIAVLVNLRADIIATRTAPLGSTDPAAVAGVVADLVKQLAASSPEPISAVGVCLGGQVLEQGVVG